MEFCCHFGPFDLLFISAKPQHNITVLWSISCCLVFLLVQVCDVFLYHQIVDDESLTFHRILAHIVFQEFLHLVVLVKRHLFQSHIRTDEVGKFVGRDFAQSFKTGDFRIWSQ